MEKFKETNKDKCEESASIVLTLTSDTPAAGKSYLLNKIIKMLAGDKSYMLHRFDDHRLKIFVNK